MNTAVCWNHLYKDWSQVSESRICVTTVIKATFLYRHWTGFHLWLVWFITPNPWHLKNKYCLILPSITYSFKAFTKVTKAVKCKKVFLMTKTIWPGLPGRRDCEVLTVLNHVCFNLEWKNKVKLSVQSLKRHINSLWISFSPTQNP